MKGNVQLNHQTTSKQKVKELEASRTRVASTPRHKNATLKFTADNEPAGGVSSGQMKQK